MNWAFKRSNIYLWLGKNRLGRAQFPYESDAKKLCDRPVWTARPSASVSNRGPPIAKAPALPVVRKRCDHLTTVATLTLNILAVARRERPPATDVTTRSRKSCE